MQVTAAMVAVALILAVALKACAESHWWYHEQAPCSGLCGLCPATTAAGGASNSWLVFVRAVKEVVVVCLVGPTCAGCDCVCMVVLCLGQGASHV